MPSGRIEHGTLDSPEIVTEVNDNDQWEVQDSDGNVIARFDQDQVVNLFSDLFDAANSQTVYDSSTQKLTAPVETTEVNNDNYVEPQATASASTSYNADLATSNYHKVTMTGDVTFDFTNADGSEVNSLVLHLVQDATGGRTPSFTPTVVWDGGSAPSWSTGANAEDVVTFVHDQDGSQWLGFLGGIGFA